MRALMTMSYTPDLYDRKFVEVVDFLIGTKRKHGLFKTQKKFMEILGLEEHHYPGIRKKDRGVPDHRRKEITELLDTKFGVNPNYLFFGIKPMFNNPPQGITEEALSYITAKDVATMKERIAELEGMVKQKDDIIADLRFIIDTLKHKNRVA